MVFDDTGTNIPEIGRTLLAQQAQLLTGRRQVQMFPAGLSELPLPHGFERHQNRCGVFHFHPSAISTDKIDELSASGRENEILNLGPYNKSDVIERMESGESLVAVAEIDPDGLEIRAAAGTASTLPEQIRYFEATKEEANMVAIIDMAELLARRLLS
jgi:hypothetical protein